MADTPAPLPSLGLLDGLGTAPSGATDSPAPLPSLGLLGGLGEAFVATQDPVAVWHEPVPAAWFADIGFAAIYAWTPLGIPVNARDEVAEESANQGGDPAFLPHIGLLLAAGGSPPDPEPEASRQVGAGRSRRARQRLVISIDGIDLIVSSPEEAQALIDDVKVKAEATAQLALDRANASKRRPVGKVLRDARKTLSVPTIEAPPEVAEYAAKAIREIRERYEAQLRDIEITALLHKQQQQEEDDEDILLLIA